jgi:adenylate kinase family enzyme
VRRINVIGSSGAGKTTVSAALARRLGSQHLELDSIHHLADWEPIDPGALRSKVGEFVAGEAWVVDGNYSIVRDIVWARVDTVVFLDLPRWRVMTRLVPRTLRRTALREELWNGNRERWRNLVSTRPEQNLLLWSWTRHDLQRQRFAEAQADPAWSHIRFIRLASAGQIDRFVASVTPD